MIDGHGDDSFRYGTRIRHNFSTNICSDVDHSALIGFLADKAASIKSYPEPRPESVERLIAMKLGIGKGNVMVTNGATEAIYLTAHLFQNGKSAIVSPTFREYQDACAMYGHSITFISSLSEIPSDTTCVWLCNPNNPTGKTVDRDSILETASKNPAAVFIVDQAYSDYTLQPLVTPAEAAGIGNLMILSSLTKRFAVPGLRIGYAVGSEKLMSEIGKMRMPWSVNQLAIEAARFLINHSDDYVIDSRGLHAEALRIGKEMAGMGITSTETDCNFLLARLPNGKKASQLKDFLIDRYGILIRDASNFEGLDGSYFRIAAQRHEENDLLLTALREWMSQP